MSNENIDPTSQPKPDRQFWDYEPAPDEDGKHNAALDPTTVEIKRLQRWVAVLTGLVVSMSIVTGMYAASAYVARNKERARLDIVIGALSGVAERARQNTRRIREAEADIELTTEDVKAIEEVLAMRARVE